jgi:hypothetical protein
VFSKIQNYENVKYMYRDNPNILIIPLLNDFEVVEYLLKYDLFKDTIKIGFGGEINPNSTSFDEGFYFQHNIPFKYRFSKFHLLRDLDLENKIYQKLNPNDEKFIFCHGEIDNNKIRHDLKIIKNPTEYSLFNLITLFEKAEEIHLMESSIKCLVNSYDLINPKLFYHKYVRGYSDWNNTKSLNNFITIE